MFHMVFGKSVPDISTDAVANLGYADVRFEATVYPGDTVRAHTTVLGRRRSARGDTGVVGPHIRLQPAQRGSAAFIRWVLMNKRDPSTATGVDDAPNSSRWTPRRSTCPLSSTAGLLLERYRRPRVVGPRPASASTVEGVAIEEAKPDGGPTLPEHGAGAPGAYALQGTRFGKRVIYGGHIISMARALGYNGLENAVRVLAFNGGTHSNPTFAGDTVFAWTDVIERIDLGRPDAGALRLRLVGVKNHDPHTEETSLRVADEQGAGATTSTWSSISITRS
ncbi:MAG: hypothetical protein U0360_05520 [Dehalococcoidia bacterium]